MKLANLDKVKLMKLAVKLVKNVFEWLWFIIILLVIVLSGVIALDEFNSFIDKNHGSSVMRVLTENKLEQPIDDYVEVYEKGFIELNKHSYSEDKVEKLFSIICDGVDYSDITVKVPLQLKDKNGMYHVFILPIKQTKLSEESYIYGSNIQYLGLLPEKCNIKLL